MRKISLITKFYEKFRKCFSLQKNLKKNEDMNFIFHKYQLKSYRIFLISSK